MKKYYLVFIFVFTSGFLMAQFTKTITEKDGSTITITKTQDTELRYVYTEEVHDKNGKLTSKKIYKKDLLGRWEVEIYERRYLDNGQTEYRLGLVYWFNEKGEWTRVKSYDSDGKFDDAHRNSDGSIGPGDDDWVHPDGVKMVEYDYGISFGRLEKLDEEEKKKKSKDKKVSLYLGPSILNGDSGSSRESFFGGQVYALFNINSNIGIGADFSLNSKKDGNQKSTHSLILARGQYDFFTGDSGDKKVIPEAHILFGLGLESFKYTSDGNTSKSSGSGPAYGVGAGVGINISPNINLGISVDYIGVKYKNTNSTNSNIRASAGIIFGI